MFQDKQSNVLTFYVLVWKEEIQEKFLQCIELKGRKKGNTMC